METHVEKIDAILDAISQDITERESIVEKAMLTLEQLKTSKEDYKMACRVLSYNWFAIGYLKHIKNGVETRDIKSAENIIRFHAYKQHTVGTLDDGQDVSVGQAYIATTLDRYVAEFFDAE